MQLFGLEPGQRTWRGVALLLGVYLGAILFAAVAAPVVYKCALWLADAFPSRLTVYLAHHKFSRYFDRLRWLPVILGLFWLAKTCGLRNLAELGFRGRFWPDSAGWLMIGVGMMAAVALPQALFLHASPSEPLRLSPFLQAALGGLAGGIALGLLEEAVFRGLVFRIFHTAAGVLPGATLASLFFAAVHFKSVRWDSADVVGWSSGFDVGWQTLASPALTFEPMRFFVLFMAGFALCMLFHRTHSLWPCVGLHAGWVLFRAVYGKFVDIEGGDHAWALGTEALTDGLAPAIALGALAIILIRRANVKR